MFRSLIVNTIPDAVETFCCSPNDYHIIDKYLVKRLRVLLKGQACVKHVVCCGAGESSAPQQSTGLKQACHSVDKKPDVKFTALSNVAVFQKCSMIPSYIEIPINRIKQVQRWIRDKSNNQWILTIYFSPRLPFEQTGFSFNDVDRMHPWAQQFYESLGLLNNIEKGAAFLAKLGGDLHKLIWDEPLGEEFVNLNVRELESWWLLADSPPPRHMQKMTRNMTLMAPCSFATD